MQKSIWIYCRQKIAKDVVYSHNFHISRAQQHQACFCTTVWQHTVDSRLVRKVVHCFTTVIGSTRLQCQSLVNYFTVIDRYFCNDGFMICVNVLFYKFFSGVFFFLHILTLVYCRFFLFQVCQFLVRFFKLLIYMINSQCIVPEIKS